MARKKKLQVFVSSTYEDLKEERQIAVQAILNAGHIPAGMELFAAGDESQMKVIQRWIDESDVFMLILGGRYGSIEPVSKKSYIEVEYEYAHNNGKPSFAIVIDEKYLDKKIKRIGASITEKDHPDDLKRFREIVRSRIVSSFNDLRDIPNIIFKSLKEIGDNYDLAGWVPGDEFDRMEKDINKIASEKQQLEAELHRLRKENNDLKDEIETPRFSGLTHNEMSDLLNKTKLSQNEIYVFDKNILRKLVKIFGDPEPSILHIFWVLSRKFQSEQGIKETDGINRVLQKLTEAGLIQMKKKDSISHFYITENGRDYLLQLKMGRQLAEAEKYIWL